MKKSVHVRVPCSTSNLGPGLDCLGLALSLYLDLEMEIDESGEGSLVWEGEGSELSIEAAAKELMQRSAAAVFEAVGKECPPLKMKTQSSIPIRAGMGSSGAAIVAAIMAANGLCDRALTTEEMVTLATEIEGHPDNVSPSLYGGLTVSYRADDSVVVNPYEVPWAVKVAVLLPAAQKAGTAESRKSFPQKIDFADCIFNQGRTAAIVGGLISGYLKNGRALFADRLHQLKRSEKMPWLYDAINAAYDAGALGAFLSGAGPAVAAFCREEDLPIVLESMDNAVAEHGLPSRRYGLDIAKKGAEFLPL